MTAVRKKMCATCIYRCKDIKRTTPHTCHEDYSHKENTNKHAAICAGSTKERGTVTRQPMFAKQWSQLLNGTYWCFVDMKMKPRIAEFYEAIVDWRNGKNSNTL